MRATTDGEARHMAGAVGLVEQVRSKVRDAALAHGLGPAIQLYMIGPERFAEVKELQHYVALTFSEKLLRQGHIRSGGIQGWAAGALAGCDEVLRSLRDVAVAQRHLSQNHIAIERRIPAASAGAEPFLGIGDRLVGFARGQRGPSQSR